MSALLQQTHSYSEYNPLDISNESPSAVGEEGREIEKAAVIVLQHWLNRSEPRTLSDDYLDTSYRHVPLEKFGTIRVRYKQARPLRPRPFVLEDE